VKTFNKISYIPEFKKDLKKLSKRFRTLEEDLNIFIESQLKIYHKLGIDNHGIFKISDLNIKCPEIYKARKFACRSLKGKGVYSGIRLIYTYFEDEDKVELIEIYYKQDKEKEDRERILRYYGEKGK
jgi:mRNA-degrading endonuclease RelE of RelBE toxin-antitoxin system